MTIPINTISPLYGKIAEDDDPKTYMRDLLFNMQQRDQQIVQVVNGDIRGTNYGIEFSYTPIIKDTLNDSTEFTYTTQFGFSLRQGVMTDIWFDVAWNTPTGPITGKMYIQLPYKVARATGMPFVGVAQPSGFAFTGGTSCVINAIQDTIRAEVWNTGSGFTTANQSSVATGRIIGHVRYIGQQNEDVEIYT